MVGCEHSSAPRLGQAADRHLEGGIVAQRIAVVGVFIAGGDQQRAEADHLGKAVPHPLGRSRIGDAAGQPVGDPELALDLGQAAPRRHPRSAARRRRRGAPACPKRVTNRGEKGHLRPWRAHNSVRSMRFGFSNRNLHDPNGLCRARQRQTRP
jgi:hypothetical protein